MNTIDMRHDTLATASQQMLGEVTPRLAIAYLAHLPDMLERLCTVPSCLAEHFTPAQLNDSAERARRVIANGHRN